MTFADTLSYFTTLFAIAIAPGPVVLMLMVRAAGNDTRGAISFGLGYALGGVIIIGAVCYGLGTWLSAIPEFFEYSKYIMLAYLLWLAFGIWRGGFNMNADCDTTKRAVFPDICAGTATCFISPYMMLLLPLVLPGLIDVSNVESGSFMIITLATFAALATGAGLVIGFSAQLRRIVRNPVHVVRMNRTLATMLAFGGGWMAFS